MKQQGKKEIKIKEQEKKAQEQLQNPQKNKPMDAAETFLSKYAGLLPLYRQNNIDKEENTQSQKSPC